MKISFVTWDLLFGINFNITFFKNHFVNYASNPSLFDRDLFYTNIQKYYTEEFLLDFIKIGW